MDQIDPVSIRVEGLRQLVRLLLQTLVLPMLVAVFFVPVVAIGDRDGPGDIERLHLVGLALLTPDFAEQLEQLSESFPYSAAGGLWITRVGLVVLTLGVLLTAVAVLTQIDRTSPRSVAAVRIALGLLAAGAVLIAIGLGWFPEYDPDFVVGQDESGGIDVGPSWGLWIPLLAAAWIAVAHAKLVDVTRG